MTYKTSLHWPFYIFNSKIFYSYPTLLSEDEKIYFVCNHCDNIFDLNGLLDDTPTYGELLVGAGLWTGEQLEITAINSIIFPL